MTRSRGESLTGKADQVFRDFEKLPPALTLKMISVFLMPASMDDSLISVTQAGRPSPISSQIRINLELKSISFPGGVFYEIIQGERSVLIQTPLLVVC